MRKVRNSSACTNNVHTHCRRAEIGWLYIYRGLTQNPCIRMIKLLMKDDIEDVLLGC
jgi:hypothetical protein